jgi:hypothetical protein
VITNRLISTDFNQSVNYQIHIGRLMNYETKFGTLSISRRHNVATYFHFLDHSSLLWVMWVQACVTEDEFFLVTLVLPRNQDSSVGIATGYGLDGSWIESRWGRDFSQKSRPASCTTGTGGFSAVKGPGCGVDLRPFLLPGSRKSIAIFLTP